jgi:hypothetical protein
MAMSRFARFLSSHDFVGSPTRRRCHDELSIIAGRERPDAATATLRAGVELPNRREDRTALVA